MTDFAPAGHLNRGISVQHSFNGSTARFDYGFDAANRIKYEQRDSGAADGFSFDPRNELTGFNQNGTLNANGTVSAAYNLSITYDANGNRIDASDANEKGRRGQSLILTTPMTRRCNGTAFTHEKARRGQSLRSKGHRRVR